MQMITALVIRHSTKIIYL